MADNYLEKRYRDVFGSSSGFNAETGYDEQRHSKPAVPRIPKFRKVSTESEKVKR